MFWTIAFNQAVHNTLFNTDQPTTNIISSENLYLMLVSLGCLRVLIEGVKIRAAIFKKSTYSRGKFAVINPPAEKFFQKGRSCFVPNFINHCRHWIPPDKKRKKEKKKQRKKYFSTEMRHNPLLHFLKRERKKDRNLGTWLSIPWPPFVLCIENVSPKKIIMCIFILWSESFVFAHGATCSLTTWQV